MKTIVYRIVLLMAIVVFSLTSCSNKEEKSEGTSKNDSDNVVLEESKTQMSESSTDSAEENTVSGDSDIDVSDMFTDRDSRTEYEKSEAVNVSFNGDSIACNSTSVSISGSTVTVKENGCYVFSGTLNNGMIKVDCDDSAKPQLVLNGVDISCESSAPIYIVNANKVFLTLADGSTNSLTNGGSFVAIDDNNIDGVIFSKTDLTLNGNGNLTVSTTAGHGVVCKDDLAITGGEYTVNCSSHGFSANNSVRIADITANITAGKDGIHAEHNEDTSKGFVYIEKGNIQINCAYDGISASSQLQIEDGAFNIVTGGGAKNVSGGGYYSGMTSDSTTVSMKGIKATTSIIINGGSFSIDSADDAFHSNSNVTVNGGDFQIKTGDDGFHADESLTVNDGTIAVSQSYEGLEALDVCVNGGTISVYASDDGVNAAGGTDSSGMGGGFGNDNFGPGGRPQKPGRKMGGGMMSAGNGSIVINGGDIYINASGDGIDANGYLEINGGNTVVCGPTRGDTATLDYDTSATISGGTFIGTGASGGMAQTFSVSPQGVISVNVGNQSAGSEITVTDSEGKVLVTHSPELDFGIVIFSSPDTVKGESFTVKVGGTTATFTAE